MFVGPRPRPVPVLGPRPRPVPVQQVERREQPTGLREGRA
ncbi:hypothetical protein BH20ACT9_BH20ACT9_21650 [soil metagenome]